MSIYFLKHILYFVVIDDNKLAETPCIPIYS